MGNFDTIEHRVSNARCTKPEGQGIDNRGTHTAAGRIASDDHRVYRPAYQLIGQSGLRKPTCKRLRDHDVPSNRRQFFHYLRKRIARIELTGPAKQMSGVKHRHSQSSALVEK